MGSEIIPPIETRLCVFTAIREKGLAKMVKIIDEYFYTADGKCYTLYRVEVKEKLIHRTKEKSGEIGEVKSCLGYFKDLAQMVRAVADNLIARKINNGEIETIHQHIEEYKNAVKVLTDAVNGISE